MSAHTYKDTFGFAQNIWQRWYTPGNTVSVLGSRKNNCYACFCDLRLLSLCVTR